jgi:hypothetical protein
MKKELLDQYRPESYWVVPGKFMAGENPAKAYFEEDMRRRLRALLALNIDCFIDLTRPGETHQPYQPLLEDEANGYGIPVEYINYPIGDMGTPPDELMKRILDTIQEKTGQNRVVYLHCLAGIGRTGTVVGCYLVRNGLSGPAALKEIMALRSVIPGYPFPSPESDAQREMILTWQG